MDGIHFSNFAKVRKRRMVETTKYFSVVQICFEKKILRNNEKII